MNIEVFGKFAENLEVFGEPEMVNQDGGCWSFLEGETQPVK